MSTSPRIWFNGELVNNEDANVHVSTHALHYGSSVFEGIRCYETPDGPAVFRLREHMQRLVNSAKIYRMDCGYTVDQLMDAVTDTIADSGLSSCYIRPVIYRGGGGLGVNPLKNKVETFVMVLEWGRYLGPEALEQGVDVMTASWARMAPNTLPSLSKAGGNYLNAALVKMDAVLNGYVEGIMLSTSGHLAEGSGENLFVVKNGTIYTAPLTMSILNGITRASIMRLADEKGYKVREESIPREALYLADEVFFTGTAVEVTPIKTIDKHVIGSGSRGPITKDLQQTYFDIVGGNDPYGWLTHVKSQEPVAG